MVVDARGTRGGQESIFGDGVVGSIHIEIKRAPELVEEEFLRKKYGHLPAARMEALLSALLRLQTGEIQPQYIMRYGFYEGHTVWRTGPIAIAFIFGLRDLGEMERAFPRRLDHVLLDHFTLGSGGRPPLGALAAGRGL